MAKSAAQLPMFLARSVLQGNHVSACSQYARHLHQKTPHGQQAQPKIDEAR